MRIFNKILLSCVATAVAVAFSATQASAAAFTNGSFESGPAVGAFSTLTAIDTSITGWEVDFGQIDYVGSYWTAQDGSRSLDMAGSSGASSPSSISQTFDTIVATIYDVSFWMSANPFNGHLPNPKAVTVQINGVTDATYFYDGVSTGNTTADMKWELHTFSFLATTTSTKLTFLGSTPSDPTIYGAALDNVSVTSGVPEPASLAMWGLGAIVMGAARKRRKTVVSE